MYGDTKVAPMYSWSTTGGRLGSAGAGATINTAGLAPGRYTVTGHAVQGPKPKQRASCTAVFAVEPYQPPNLTCRATPSSAPSGTTFDISATGISPDNRPLTYAYKTSAGQLMASGVTARLITKNVQAGSITVTCYAVDDRGLSATASAQITLAKPMMPANTSVRGATPLCTLNFTRDRVYPARIDAQSEICLDSIAYTLRHTPGTKVVIVGNASPDEPPERAAERSMNARDYLVRERAIERVRIEVRVGETSGRTADTTLFPLNAEFTQINTSVFDESLITRHGPAYVPPSDSHSHIRNRY